MPLTDTKVKNAKPSEKAFKLTDGFGPYLLVHPNGQSTGSWVIPLKRNKRCFP